MENITVDVQRIMEEIKAEIDAKGLVNDIPSMEDALSCETAARSLDVIQHELSYLKQYKVHYYREITSYRPWLTPIVKFVKRVIRKLCRFLGEPAIDEINEYNRHIVKVIEHTVKVMEQQAALAAAPEGAILEERRYKQLAEQYSSSNFRLEREIEKMKELEDAIKILQKKSEYVELSLEIIERKQEQKDIE